MSRPLLLDVIGDVHGQLDALTTLCCDLGYAVEDDWSHPDGRLLLFLGDLVDRGPRSLEVAEQVAALVTAERALCLLGNHEYNLVGWHLGLDRKPRGSNKATRLDLLRRPERWAPLLSFFAGLPMAVVLPGLRVIHAVWHGPCLERVAPRLAPEGSRPDQGQPHSSLAGSDRPVDRLRAAVVLGPPFRGGALLPDLPAVGLPPAPDRDHEILIKGPEEHAQQAFGDADGSSRKLRRVIWWAGPCDDIPRDGVTVFGHYWNIPPAPDGPDFTPALLKGHPGFEEWRRARSAGLPPRGRLAVPGGEPFVCIDYNGTCADLGSGCVGAYRWPEHEVAWAMAVTSR